MRTLLSALLALASLLFSLGAFAQQIVDPPTAALAKDDFSPMTAEWQPASGTWSVGNGTYGNSSTAVTNITRITEYAFGTDIPSAQIHEDEYFARARMRNRGSGETDLVGLVYGYQDSQNYYEALISATGAVTMRTVMNGVAVEEAPAKQSDIPRDTWLEVEVRWNRGVASLKINGRSFYTSIPQPEFTDGQVGLVTHSATARFDKVFVGVPFGDQGFLETFSDASSKTFTPQSGQWSVVNGTYRNSAVQQTNVTLAPIHTTDSTPPGDATTVFTFRARMLNPYANAGNLVGIVFNYEDGANYSEVVFSPKGTAKVNRVEHGALSTLATASYAGTRNVAFEVTLEDAPNLVSVSVDGDRIFENVAAANQPSREGAVGLITHWAPGRFDNVQFDHGIFQYVNGSLQPCSIPFDQPLPPQSVVSGNWDTDGGTLNSTGVHQNDIVALPCSGNDIGDDAGTDEIYSAKLRNEFGASGNLVGLTYNYDRGDYFEVVFSATGSIQLNKFIEGVRYPVATRTHSIPRNTWFDVQVIRTGIFTTLKLDGATIVQDLPQGELRGGRIGAITHWTRGHFDDVSLEPHVSRPTSEL
jgi:hypothetical protein